MKILRYRPFPAVWLEESPYLGVRRAIALVRLGRRWLLHPVNAVRRPHDFTAPSRGASR